MLWCRRSIASMALSDGMCARQLQGLIRGTRTDFFRCQLRRDSPTSCPFCSQSAL